MYKKIFSLIILVAMLLSVCACSNTDSETGAIADDNNVTNNATTENLTDNTDESGESEQQNNENAVDGVVNSTRPNSNNNVTSENTTGNNDETTDNKVTEDSTKPDGTGEPENTIKPDDATQPDNSNQPDDTAPTNPDTTFDPSKYTYKDYQDMTGEEQEAFFEKFESTEAFFDWLNAAKKDDKELNPDKEISSDGTITLE